MGSVGARLGGLHTRGSLDCSGKVVAMVWLLVLVTREQFLENGVCFKDSQVCVLIWFIMMLVQVQSGPIICMFLFITMSHSLFWYGLMSEKIIISASTDMLHQCV